jgi:hypothetical protein
MASKWNMSIEHWWYDLEYSQRNCRKPRPSVTLSTAWTWVSTVSDRWLSAWARPGIVCSVPLDVASQKNVTWETVATFMSALINVIIYAIICASVYIICIRNHTECALPTWVETVTDVTISNKCTQTWSPIYIPC